jgi:geranylgeranyl pyrophosphate synthase
LERPSLAPDEAVDDSLRAERVAIERALTDLCDRALHGTAPRVAEVIRYSLLGEGKRLRGLLVSSTYGAAGGTGDAAPLAAAVEVVHAYSLIHDDLPCMDNDDVRRGRPSAHRAFGVRAATAAGVAMVPLAAHAAYTAAQALGLDAVAAGSIVGDLMRASGAAGMVGGQLLDLQAEGRRLALRDLERVHRAKTGMLIAASARIGARAAGADGAALSAFTEYGAGLGLAFQIADDVLDVTATTHQLGKTAGKDAALQKSTYPQLLGVDGALERARALAGEACAVLQRAGRLTAPLVGLARYVVERRS